MSTSRGKNPVAAGSLTKRFSVFRFSSIIPIRKKLIHSIELIASNEQRAMLEMTNPIVIIRAWY